MDKKSIYIPLAFAIVFAVGIFLGRVLSDSSFFQKDDQKAINKYGQVIKLVEEHYVEPVNVGELIDNSLKETLKELDPHSAYVPQSFASYSDAGLESDFEGIGVYFTQHRDTLCVEYAIHDGPARTAGVMTGDLIVEVDDSTFIGATTALSFKKLRGKSGSKVKLKVKRGNEFHDIVVVRRKGSNSLS